MLHRIAIVWLFSLAGLFFSGIVNAQQQSVHALRSAYLYYFSHFITWPDSTQFERGELHLCVLTENEKDSFQLSTIDNKLIGKNRLKIQFLDKHNDRVDHCHMLYVTAPYRLWLLANAGNLNRDTLLVTEGNLLNKGDIHLYLLENKLKFEIDNSGLTVKDFKASSKLLRLSKKRGSQ
ncbi:YfiR family protein [Teredinibacter purpureus]|uniref:YfiR family protein n=1 Tax=Teredinibacter purpureus TaxID=2731756 RepID=UPI0013C4E873|nr:YfiR family protein [Teredinibacter purpureus]